ncbi:hypothetical protein SK128_009155, partial [Halocaridina rubra]
DYFGVPTAHVHFIGHSLGAHLAGYTGEYLKAEGTSLGRITGEKIIFRNEISRKFTYEPHRKTILVMKHL